MEKVNSGVGYGKIQEYQYHHADKEFTVTDDMKASFNKDGGIIVKNILDKEEIELVLKALEGNPILDQAWDVPDDEGRAARLLIWTQPGHDVTGMVGRCDRIVSTCEKLLDEEVYHFHTKLMMKEARFGGKHLWHQDYGYWYNNACLKPDLMTVFIPLDKCTKQNGCLQVIPGSNRCGRLEHTFVAGQQSLEPERLKLIMAQNEFPKVHVEMEPGDALFFHCNLLHKSDQNSSDMRRWAFLIAYNAKSNSPVTETECPSYTPIQKVDNNAIKTCKILSDFTDKKLWDPKKDHTIKLDDANGK